jgi:hypothetical protein
MRGVASGSGSWGDSSGGLLKASRAAPTRKALLPAAMRTLHPCEKWRSRVDRESFIGWILRVGFAIARGALDERVPAADHPRMEPRPESTSRRFYEL